jgi:hypothetical protein
MDLSTIGYTRNASRDARFAWLALDSDHNGLVDSDSLTQRGGLHQLFEGAVVVSEWDDDEPSFDDIEFDD